MNNKAPWFTMSEFEFTLSSDDNVNQYTMKWEQNPINYLLTGSITIHTLTGENYRPSITWSLVDRPNKPEHSNLFIDLLEKHYAHMIETSPAPVLGISHRIDLDSRLILLNIDGKPLRLVFCPDGNGDFIHEITSHLFPTRKHAYRILTPDIEMSDALLEALAIRLSLFDLTPEAHKYKCIIEEKQDVVCH